MQNFTELNHCRVCGNEHLEEVLDLNKQPLANSYHNGEEEQETYPLKINVCTECFHVQLSVVVNPDLMFKDYLYVSGTSKTLHAYFEDFADLCERYSRGRRRVLDIACNDGTQLHKFKERGWKTYGVDPAENLYPLSSINHNVVCDYWSAEVAEKMYEIFDAIIAQNVFAHTHDIHGFLKACAIVADERTNVFIQTSQADMIINNEFDTIYHEHLSFFNTKSMKTCANLNGFSLVGVLKATIHGGSYVFILRKGEHDESIAEAEIKKEQKLGLYDLKTYVKYAKKCKEVMKSFNKEIKKFKKKDYKVIGYGAAAKGNTFLNFGKTDLDYIVDDNELKWNLLTPGRNIMIKDPSALAEEDTKKIVVIPLAWNFFNEISEKANEITNSQLSFIKYFPEVRVI
jgi:2-polyprenyl-3-methyl-5-hydroxy-6-metoxy-1,4-benzoquinol methylase